MTFASELVAFALGGIIFLAVSAVTSLKVQSGPKAKFEGWWWWVIMISAIVTGSIYSTREVVGDTEVYEKAITFLGEFGYDPGKAWLFNAYAFALSRVVEVPTVLMIITVTISVGMGIGMSRCLKDPAGAATACAVLFTSFYCLGIQSNVLRHGMALAILMVGLPELLGTEGKALPVARAILIGVLAAGFHSSVLYVFAPALVLAYLIRFRAPLVVITGALFTLLAMFGWGIEQLPYLGDLMIVNASEYSGYLDNIRNDNYYRVGFRADFALFVWFFAAWGLFVWYKLRFRDVWYGRVLVLYMLIETLFICSFNIPFCDRIGLYGFVLIPIIVCYPFGRLRSLSGTDVRMFLNACIGLNFLFTLVYFGRFWVARG